MRGRLSRQFPQLTGLLCTVVDALVEPGGPGVAGSNPVVPTVGRAVPYASGCRPDLRLCQFVSDLEPILLASILDGLLRESGASLEHSFSGREMGQVLLQFSDDVERCSALLRAVGVGCLLKITITPGPIFVRGARGQGVSRALLLQARISAHRWLSRSGDHEGAGQEE